MVARNRTLFLRTGLCLLCLGAGFQSSEAVRLWLDGGAVHVSAWKAWSETLKAGAMFFFAVAVYCNVAMAVRRVGGRQPPPA